jgi:mono/diheme cytochrome c family protein
MGPVPKNLRAERLRSAAEGTDALRRGASASAWHRAAANLPCQNRWWAPGERQERTAFDEPDTSRDNAAMTIRTAFVLMLASLAACACTVTRGPATPILSAEASNQGLVEHGLAFAQRHCAACHAVETGGSPNPQAPPFDAIINQQDLSAETLKPWLRDSHDFPAMMNFAIDPEKIDELAAYMLTLKDPAYRPAIQ